MGQPLFDLISNIIKRRSYPSISDGMHLEIRIKKCGISTPSVFASVMIHVFPSFEHSTGVSAIRSLSAVCRTHSVDCQNVEETRNPMQKPIGKKCMHFFQRIFHLHFHLKSVGCVSYHIT